MEEGKHHKKIRVFIGWFYVTIGIVGIIVPIMPGWIFLIAGGSILHWKWVRLLVEKVKVFFIRKSN